MEGAFGQMKVFFDGLAREAKQIPYTVIGVIALYVVMIYYVLPTVVQVKTNVVVLVRLERQFKAMDGRMQLSSARSLVLGLDSQLFQLEQEQRRADRAGEQVSEVVLQQLHDVQNKKAIATIELDALLRRSAEDSPR